MTGDGPSDGCAIEGDAGFQALRVADLFQPVSEPCEHRPHLERQLGKRFNDPVTREYGGSMRVVLGE